MINLQQTSPWTDDDVLFLKENYKDFTHAQLAEKLGRTKTAVDLKLSRLGLKKSKYVYNQEYFDCIDSEDKAYWLGFIFADGYVRILDIGQHRNHELGIELKASDDGHLKKFNKSINGNIPVKYRDRQILWENYNEPRAYRTCLIRIYSSHICNSLNKYNIANGKSHDLKFPDSIPKHLMPAFIRGFFDGDGSICDDKQHKIHKFDFTCASLEFLSDLRTYLFNEYNVCSYICENHKDSNVYKLYIRGMTNAYNFGVLLYENANIYLDRKYNRFFQITKQYDIQNRINIRNKSS